MEVTYDKVVSFLQKQEWKNVGSNDRFTYFKPPADMGFEDDYLLPVPTLFQSSDYKQYLLHTAKVIAQFYDLSLEELFFDVSDHISILKRKAIYLKLASKEVRQDHSVDATHVSNLLKNLIKSYENYLRVQFSKLFGEKYRFDSMLIKSAANKLIDISKLRVVDLEFKSFSFGVSVDTMMGKEFIDYKEVVTWRENALPMYKKDVLDADYYSQMGLDKIKEMFEPSERKAIYEPIINAVNSNDYAIFITTSEYNPIKTIKPISKPAVVEIIPPSIQTPDTPNIEYIQTITPIDAKTGKPLSYKKSSFQAGIFTSVIKDFPIQQIPRDGEVLKFSTPLQVTLDSNNDNEHILTIENFNLYVKDSNFNEAQKKLADLIWEYYDLWEKKDKDFFATKENESIIDFFSKNTIKE